jgi:hypothetical protein
VPSQAKVGYGFRLRFHLPPGHSFARAHPRRRLPLDDIQGKIYLIRLPQQKRNRFGARTRYAIVGTSFPSHTAAREAGERIRKTLSFFAAERRIGLDCQDRPGASFSQVIKDTIAREHGVQLRDDIHGLDVYAEEMPVTRFTFEGYASVAHELDDYENRLVFFFRANPSLSEKQRLALDLYNLSHFEGTAKTRFLTLITVIEVLATRQKRPVSVRALLKKFKEQATEADLQPEALRSLSDALGTLERQSIGEACRQFVIEHASAEDAVYFTNCYKARSQLVHSGRTDRPEASDPTKLNELVSCLILRSLAKEV